MFLLLRTWHESKRPEDLQLVFINAQQGFCVDPNKFLQQQFDDNSEIPDELAKKIKAVKQVLEDPPDSLWNYDMIESIVIQYEENGGILSDKQIEQIEKCYAIYC